MTTEKTQSIALLAEKYPTVTAAIMYTIAALVSLKISIVAFGHGLSFLAGAVLSFATKAHTAFSLLSTYAIPAVITELSFFKSYNSEPNNISSFRSNSRSEIFDGGNSE